MCIRQLGRTLSILAAVLGGVITAVIFYYVAGLDLALLFWVAIGLSALLLVTLLILSSLHCDCRTSIARYLQHSGSFLLICLIGTILTAAIGLALATALAGLTTSLPALALVFLFGFFFTGLLFSLLFYLLDDDIQILPQPAPEPPCNTISYR